jgi:Domain of unknown function (DUF4390)
MTDGLRRLLGVAVVALAIPAVVDSEIRVTPLVAEGKVSASFSAPAGFSDDARAVLASGLLLTFTYAVELRRPASIWFDPALAQTSAAADAKLDTLTGVYQVSKSLDGRVVWSDRTSDEAQVRNWITAFERVPLDTAQRLEPNVDYYVQVRLQVTPRRTFYLWPWGRGDGAGRAIFTFLR